MSAQFGPQSLPYPQPSEAPDGPGAFLALLQKMQVGGIIVYPTLDALNAVTDAFEGQHATVTADPVAASNGDYVRSGSTWVLRGGDTGWITPTLGNGWTSVTGLTVQYRRLNRVTWMQGRATGGTSGTAFTIPAGFRPSQSMVLAVMEGATTATATRVVVNATGAVDLLAASNPNFGAISFPADA